MGHFVDRRLNPKDKSLGNRRRFLKRVRSHVKKSVDEAVRERGIADADRGERVIVPSGSISEPTFRHSTKAGRREYTSTGNKSFRTGDKIKKPPAGGAGGGGKTGTDTGEGEDDFLFVLSREEFLDLFFEDMELPNLVKRGLKQIEVKRPHRAGYSITGSPANISVERTMRNSLGRRMALKRPKDLEVRELREEIFKLEAISSPTPEQRTELSMLHEMLEEMLRRQRLVAYIDPLDVRYNYFEQRPEPREHAVMFCLMDVSASMGEREKDLAKRFFVLLHLFLSRRYEAIDLVFVRHTHNAQEVDEETFFYAKETGGTVVSTALVEAKRLIEERYPPSEWNIYIAQASDGENYSGDSKKCVTLLNEELMKNCQYFAYVEIVDEAEAEFLNSEENGVELWREYRRVASRWPNFAMKRISRPADIYPVFRELFAKKYADGSSG
ncbi:YeaH/YhbH family protein [Hoeflea sp. TYP-13]|uniref:YeaH/YhbH family protein n=1 Tax=Hoeflea sp. TYP-13 TaxID=3230023 RepID=UPI0034C61F88